MENMIKSFKAMKPFEWVLAAIMIIIAGYAMVTAFLPSAAVAGVANPAWLTVVNFISAIAGVFCIFFCAKAHISNFAFGLVNTVVYIIYLWYWGIWGTFALELLFYLPMNIASWIVWARHRDHVEREKTKAKKLTKVQMAIIGAIVIVSTIIYHAILVAIGGAVAWFDAATVAIGIIATILEMRRYKEQYVLWTIQDVVVCIMYLVHFDPVYLTKKTIYLIMAVVGWINWHKLQKRNIDNE